MKGEAAMEVAPQMLPGPSTGSVQRTNLGPKDTPDILKVDSDDLKEPPTGPEVGQGWRGHGLQGRCGPCPGSISRICARDTTGCLPFDGGAVKKLSRPFSSSETNW